MRQLSIACGGAGSALRLRFSAVHGRRLRSAPPPAPAAPAAASRNCGGIGPHIPSTYQRHPNPPVPDPHARS